MRSIILLLYAPGASLGSFIEFLEDSSILGPPLNESIRAATLNHRCGGARAGKFDISFKAIKAILL
jgi:hypothetical protein